jgi:hypothetical protein
MTSQAALTAFVELALMLALVAAYVVMARRFRLLWHPLSIVAAVGIVSVVISVLGELLFNSGWAGVPAMLRRSAIGGFGWGAIIAAGVWIGRRVFALWMKRQARRF